MYQDLSIYQTTFKNIVSMEGIALHAGVPATAVLNPAPVNTGIVFRRTDIKDKNNVIPATYMNIVDTRLCSCFGNGDGATVSLSEHLMATLHAFGITNAFIDITGPEVPILDGCANGYVKYFEQAGVTQQSEKRRILKIKKEVSFVDDKGNKIVIMPTEQGFTVDFE
ncbi:MAG: UDP-3-O-acyl-N-acetylglucosamine deacetylase, partial [Alphaproteobacteria bacterium]